MKKRFLVLSLVAAIFLVSATVYATPITVGDPLWYEFRFTTVGVDAVDGTFTVPSSGGNSQEAPAPPWTFSSPVATSLRVVDAFMYGDAFNIYDFGSLIGQTSLVNIGGGTGISDPELTWLDPLFSSGTFLLAAGDHSLTIQPYQIYSSGAAYFRVDAVPEPATLLLFGSGLIVLAGIRRKFIK